MNNKKILNEINRNLQMMGVSINEDININANSLKNHLSNIGFKYGKSLDNAGDLDEDFVRHIKKIFTELDEKLPDYKFEVTSGHSKFHEKANPSSRHNKGKAIDFVVYDSDGDEVSSNDDEILDEISYILCDFRQRIPGITFIDEYRHKSAHATGNHFHISYSENMKDENSSTPKFCGDSKKELITKVSKKETEEKDEENLVDKLLSSIGIKSFTDDNIETLADKAKDVLGFDSVKEKDGKFSIFGFDLNDIKDKVLSLFEERLTEEINKMKKPLR